MSISKTNIPRIKFAVAPINKEVEMLLYFCFPGDTQLDWRDRVFQSLPELRSLLEGKTARNSKEIITHYVREYKKQHAAELAQLVDVYQKKWDRVNDEYITLLFRHFETTMPKGGRVMRARVSVIPVFPRFLDEWSFHVGRDKNHMLPIALHEILHFVYFKKWMEVFPDTRPEERESPHLVWKLSEILDPIILNKNPEIQKICSVRQGQYPEFAALRVGEKPLTELFEDLYGAHLSSTEPFADFLRRAWELAQRHRALLEKKM